MQSSAENPVALEAFDPLSEEFLRDPYPLLERARKESPVFFSEKLNSWIVTRYDDVAEVLRDFETYSSKGIQTPPPPQELRGTVPENLMEHAFVTLDPPEHTPRRKLGNTWFTRSKVAGQEDAIRNFADELIDGFIKRGQCEFMEEYAYALTVRSITDLLGLDPQYIPKFRQWTEDMFVLMQPGDGDEASEHALDEGREKRWRQMAEGWTYYQSLVDDRRANPRDDLITAMVQASKPDGTPALTDHQIITHIMELIAAGNDTTANLMGHMLMFFSDSPELIDEVRGDAELMANAVEEGLRRRGSSTMMFRIATRDVEIGGKQISKGQLVAPCFISAGHDETQFPEPRKFDPHRENASKHLSLGKGRHMCMGAPLGRTMARIGMTTLFERLPDIRVVPGQTLSYAPALTTVALHELQVSWSVPAAS